MTITTWLFAKQQPFRRSILWWFCIYFYALFSNSFSNRKHIKKHTVKSTFFQLWNEKKLFALRIDIMRLILSISSKYFRYQRICVAFDYSIMDGL